MPAIHIIGSAYICQLTECGLFGSGMRASCRVAMMRTMDLDQAREVLRSQHRAVFCALKSDGTPAMSPVLVALDDNGDVLVSTRATAYKTKQVQRDPNVWLCVLPD